MGRWILRVLDIERKGIGSGYRQRKEDVDDEEGWLTRKPIGLEMILKDLLCAC